MPVIGSQNCQFLLAELTCDWLIARVTWSIADQRWQTEREKFVVVDCRLSLAHRVTLASDHSLTQSL